MYILFKTNVSTTAFIIPKAKIFEQKGIHQRYVKSMLTKNIDIFIATNAKPL